MKIIEEKVNELVLVSNLLLERDYENCLKKAEKDILESFAVGVNTKVTKASCNKCGAGKKLYWSTVADDIKRFDAITTKVLVEKTGIRSTLYVQDITKGCPKCGGELTEEL